MVSLEVILGQLDECIPILTITSSHHTVVTRRQPGVAQLLQVLLGGDIGVPASRGHRVLEHIVPIISTRSTEGHTQGGVLNLRLSSIPEAEEGGPSVILVESSPGLLPEVLSVWSAWCFLRYTLNVEPMGLRQFGTNLSRLSDALEGILCGNPFTLWGDATESLQCA
ncbi:hypothetical protein CEDELDFK_00010 [Klebsiella phage 066025]|nr:hypothetical protein CEDELDFK_00010 [Klebsiella phage 066025]QOV06978.1 hypothetical protein KDLGFLPC_00010 [Klebsiella phage 066036]QOV07606.1 hypothetical protein CGBLCFBE_00010 [Klebsiella phage 066121]